MVKEALRFAPAPTSSDWGSDAAAERLLASSVAVPSGPGIAEPAYDAMPSLAEGSS
jgi:hypothetical protein